ncbi:Telomerase Cajal body protein 1, partial [Tetrabaena socialis]
TRGGDGVALAAADCVGARAQGGLAGAKGGGSVHRRRQLGAHVVEHRRRRRRAVAAKRVQQLLGGAAVPHAHLHAAAQRGKAGADPMDAEAEEWPREAEEAAGEAVWEAAGEEQGPAASSWGQQQQEQAPLFYNAFIFPQEPQPLYRATQEYACRPSTSCPNTNFLKGVKWSPDGACLLTASDDNWCGPLSVSCPNMRTICTCSERRGYNDADEPTAAYSLAFSPDGARLLGGYNRSIYAFDVSRPGRDYKRVVTHKRKQQESIAGIVSCIAFSPAGEVFAAGTYTGALGVYDARTYELSLLLSGNRGGLTQLMFSADGNYLYTGARQDEQMFCWDVRHTYEALYTMQRDTGRTNQRIQFDIEPCGKHLITGDCSGRVTVFDLQDGSQVDSQCIAQDTINGVAFHPAGLDLLATASGHRRYAEPGGSGDDDDTGPDEPPAPVRSAAAALPPPPRPSNSLMLWRVQCQ